MNPRSDRSNIFVLSLPRSGSSLLTQLIASGGYDIKLSADSAFLGSSEFNQSGYFEEIGLILLNDQLIRALHGPNHSFLHLPPSDKTAENAQKNLAQLEGRAQQFFYDIDENTLFIPEDFERNLRRYTGNSWDNWGLTRMRKGGKWYRCYERHHCKTVTEIVERVKFYRGIFSKNQNLVVKDPRLALVFGCYGLSKPRVVHIVREPGAVLASMRKHYGPNIFTRRFISGTDLVSNHFNLKVGFQEFTDYHASYLAAIEVAKKKSDWIEIRFEDLIALTPATIKNLEEFLGAPLDTTLIQKNLSHN